ncbi:MAG: hypothetical protein KatS3mg111_4170 [Pirellulaceae bacterium]|nr:MAG: hypothetical protein KatS3mg111_4170 [Pirellulaceae bacterium]
MQQRVNISQRRAYRVLGQARSTQRYQAKEDSLEEKKLVSRIHELVRQYPRYGHRMIIAKLRQEGWSVSFKKGQSPVATGRPESTAKDAEKAAFGA